METKGIVKERFEYIIGFLALVLSLNNFKTELAAINVDLLFIKFNLAEYFLAVIIATIISLHLYFIPQFIQGENSFIKGLRETFTFIAYTFLFLILLNPIIILITYGFARWVEIRGYTETKAMDIASFVSMGLTFVALVLTLTMLIQQHKNANKALKEAADDFKGTIEKPESTKDNILTAFDNYRKTVENVVNGKNK